MQTDRKEQLLAQLAKEPEDSAPEPATQTTNQTIKFRLIAGCTVILVVIGFVVLLGETTSTLVTTGELAEPETSAPLLTAPSPTAKAELTATGFIAARRQATVSAKIIGKIASVHIEEGEYVEQGQLIATLDNHLHQARFNLGQAQLSAAQAALSELKVMLHQESAHLTRIRHLKNQDLASESDLEEARTKRDAAYARLAAATAEVDVVRQSLMLHQAELRETEIRAPFAGVVTNKTAQPGEIVSPMSSGGGFTRTGICSLVDMKSLEIVVDVTETNINRVRPKQPVIAVLNAYPDWQLKGEVITLIPTADRNRATVRVRIQLLQTDSRILPDMGVRVTFMQNNSDQLN